MQTDNNHTPIYQAMQRHLAQGWILRRISRHQSGWKIEQWHGANHGSTLHAAVGMRTIINRKVFDDEIFILIAKDKSRTINLTTPIDLSSLTGHLNAYIHTLKYVSRGCFLTARLEEASINVKRENEDEKKWQEILDIMPECTSRIGKSAHLMLVGRNIDEPAIDSHLEVLLSPDCEEGIYTSLYNFKKVDKHPLNSFESKLIKQGFAEDALPTLQTHLQTVSDDDVGKSLKNTLLAMPWNKQAVVNRDLQAIKHELDKRLFGMNDVKQEILASIAGSLLSDSEHIRPPCLLLHGAPGTGKTAMAKAIAHALAIPFESLSMNGISTAISIVGLEPVWRSPQPGKIIQSMLHSKVRNPLILLDEIEKCGASTEHGSPTDALLQALDPTQNRTFKDLYLGIPVDISEIFFIATANDISGISEPLLDRFITIEIPEYNIAEKRSIMPYLRQQIIAEKELSSSFKFTAKALILIEENLLPKLGLRGIKASLWRMLCEAALSHGNVTEFKHHMLIDEMAVQSVLDNHASKKKKKSIGFL